MFVKRFACILSVSCAVIAAVGCGDAPTGLAPAPDGDGPTIVWQIDGPNNMPVAPFPNNFFTRREATSPTGLRVNVSIDATTAAEERLRRLVDWMDGFGLSSPITIPFSAPIDIEDFYNRQGKDHDYTNDAVLLINMNPASDNYGKPTPLEAGQGNFPLALTWPWQYWDFDEHADSGNLMFETHDENTDGDTDFDEYEDIDFDGVQDKPNTWNGTDPGLNNPDQLITFYEKQTNTLVLWPVVPLEQGSLYAVVVTKNLKGAKDEDGHDGEPVRSPFEYVNDVNQTPDLEPVVDILTKSKCIDDVNDIAFAWTFTTQTITDELVAIRDGIYGAGPLASLSTAYPVTLEPSKVWTVDETGAAVPAGGQYVLPNSQVLSLLDLVGEILYKKPMVNTLKTDTAHVDYWVLGQFTAPNFLVDRDGIATAVYPADDNESFFIDLVKGEAVTGPGKVTFMCSIPKETAEHKAPFPVMFYGHGFSSAVFEMFGFGGRMAQYGYALCATDAPGHRLALPVEKGQDWPKTISDLLDFVVPQLKTFYGALINGRIRDLDNDGQIGPNDNGGDMWGWDAFHTRDTIRQNVVDHMQFIRVLRSLGDLKWETDVNGNGKADDLMGDFNNDGVVDFGTAKNVDYPVWGQSMGAFNALLLAGVEPCVAAAAPISGAGGLIQAGLRTNNPGTPEGAMMPMMGPFVVFTPMDNGEVEIAWQINDQHKEYFRPEPGADRDPARPHYYPFASTDQIGPGDTVVIRNLTNGEIRRTFRMPLPDGVSGDTECKGAEACLAEKAACQLDISKWKNDECVKWRGWRVSMPADALAAVPKRAWLGLKDGDTQPVPVTCVSPDSMTSPWRVEEDSEGKPTGNAFCNGEDKTRSSSFGDLIQIDIYDGWVEDFDSVEPRETIDTFGKEVTFQGAVFPVGVPLVAIGTGLGYARNTPGFRQLISLASAIVERGDPIAYVPHYANREKISCGCGYDEGTCPKGVCRNPRANVIIYHSVGDPNVPIATGLNLGRASGALKYEDLENPDSDAPNDLLLKAGVAEGIEGFGRHLSDGPNKITYATWADDSLNALIKDLRWPDEFDAEAAATPEAAMPLHADPDNQDGGIDEFGEPDVPGYTPQTTTFKDKSGKVVGNIAFRIPYTYPLGSHGVEFSDPRRDFNLNNFIENQLSLFMATGGLKLSDEPCLATASCEYLPQSIQDEAAVHIKKQP